MVLVWEPIADLPEDWSSLSDGELGPLLQFWNDQRADLEQSGALAAFNQRLAREWSIETGQIEGVYDIDRGITQTLIEHGINADLIPSQAGQKPPELIAAIIQDHADVLEGLFQFVKGDRPMSKSYIHELHSALLQHQDTAVMIDQFGKLFESRLIKGKYKERSNNPKKSDGSMHVYSPPEQVESEMERLLALHAAHEARKIPVEIEAAWLHHRFAQIHPYQDGNGRVARAIASLIFLKAGWFPVVVTRDDRPRYIDSLEVADEGDLRSLVSFLTDVQKRALFTAVQAVADTKPIESVSGAIAAAKAALKSLGREVEPPIWPKAKEIANRLVDLAAKRFDEVTANLTGELSEMGTNLAFRSSRIGYHYLLPQLYYQPNSSEYSEGCLLEIQDAAKMLSSWIELQGHAIGSRYRGIIGMVMVFESGATRKSESASRESFQVNYAESYENAERRFRPWLEDSLINALTTWRKSL